MSQENRVISRKQLRLGVRVRSCDADSRERVRTEQWVRDQEGCGDIECKTSAASDKNKEDSDTCRKMGFWIYRKNLVVPGVGVCVLKDFPMASE